MGTGLGPKGSPYFSLRSPAHPSAQPGEPTNESIVVHARNVPNRWCAFVPTTTPEHKELPQAHGLR
jgi:hypothetical protein